MHGATTPDGRVYVVDVGLNALMVFEPNALDELGKPLGLGELLTWKALDRETTIAKPIAVALTWDKTLVVTDAQLGVALHLDHTGKLLGKIGAGHLQRPTGAAFDRQQGLLYIADTPTHSIKVFNRQGELVKTIGGPGIELGQFNAPTQLSFSAGQLYVSDTLNTRVQVFDQQGGFVKVLGERGLNVGNLVRPKGVASDVNGLVYIVESYYAHLLVYDRDGNFLLDINGNGHEGDSFMLPSGVWTDGKKRVYVADMFNARVVVFEFLGNSAI
jgi:DNA-binding beta-propeller fold protein YncE